MTNRAPQLIAVLACVLMVTGCQPQRPHYRFDQGDMNYYVDQATEIAYPDVETAMLAEVTHSHPPITIADAQFESFWDLHEDFVLEISI